jgi:hypothetical protein
MSYHNGDGYYFIFSDGQYVIIDLANGFPHYKIPQWGHAHNKWHFTIKENNNKLLKNDPNYAVDNIVLLDKSIVRKYNAVLIKITINHIKYKKTTQFEYDKKMSIDDPNSDNSKLYKYIMEIYYNCNNPKHIRTTLII